MVLTRPRRGGRFWHMCDTPRWATPPSADYLDHFAELADADELIVVSSRRIDPLGRRHR